MGRHPRQQARNASLPLRGAGVFTQHCPSRRCHLAPIPRDGGHPNRLPRRRPYLTPVLGRGRHHIQYEIRTLLPPLLPREMTPVYLMGTSIPTKSAMRYPLYVICYPLSIIHYTLYETSTRKKSTPQHLTISPTSPHQDRADNLQSSASTQPSNKIRESECLYLH